MAALLAHSARLIPLRPTGRFPRERGERPSRLAHPAPFLAKEEAGRSREGISATAAGEAL